MIPLHTLRTCWIDRREITLRGVRVGQLHSALERGSGGKRDSNVRRERRRFHLTDIDDIDASNFRAVDAAAAEESKCHDVTRVRRALCGWLDLNHFILHGIQSRVELDTAQRHLRLSYFSAYSREAHHKLDDDRSTGERRDLYALHLHAEQAGNIRTERSLKI